jgi:hypothetical protein
MKDKLGVCLGAGRWRQGFILSLIVAEGVLSALLDLDAVIGR